MELVKKTEKGEKMVTFALRAKGEERLKKKVGS
jgi:hypothetical protein